MAEPSPLATALAALPKIRRRLERGQQFNAYHSASTHELFYVGIGPVTDFATITMAPTAAAADLIVDALRHAAGQNPQLSRCTDPGQAHG